jgi:hypothetical protein
MKRQKTVFITPLTRNSLSTNISTNIPNVGLSASGLVQITGSFGVYVFNTAGPIIKLCAGGGGGQ